MPKTEQHAAALIPGQRVRLCDNTLEAFFGRYGTIIEVRACGPDYHNAHVIVQMDEVAHSEGHAIFYSRELVVVHGDTPEQGRGANSHEQR